MKIVLIAVIIIVIILLLLQIMTVRSTQKAERQKYTVVHHEQEFEIRFYPQAVFATIYSSAKTYRELASPGFRDVEDEDESFAAFRGFANHDPSISGDMVMFFSIK